MVLCQICHVEVNRIKGSKNLMPSVLTAPRRPPRPLQTEQQQKRHREDCRDGENSRLMMQTVDTGRGPRRPSRRVGASRCDRRRRAEAGAPNRADRARPARPRRGAESHPTPGGGTPPQARARRRPPPDAAAMPSTAGRRGRRSTDASLRASAEGAPRPPGERGEVEEVPRGEVGRGRRRIDYPPSI